MHKSSTTTIRLLGVGFAAVVAAGVASGVTSYRLWLETRLEAQAPPFHLMEATISDVHRAIRAGQITCQGLVQAYLNRAKAYNGVSNALVTADGADIPEPRGVVRAGSPLKFPTKTVKASTVLPDFDQYAGPPIEFGRNRRRQMPASSSNTG